MRVSTTGGTIRSRVLNVKKRRRRGARGGDRVRAWAATGREFVNVYFRCFVGPNPDSAVVTSGSEHEMVKSVVPSNTCEITAAQSLRTNMMQQRRRFSIPYEYVTTFDGSASGEMIEERADSPLPAHRTS